MASKLVTDRQKDAETLSALIETQSTTLIHALGSALSNDVTDSVSTLLSSLQSLLLDRRDDLVEADAEHESELADDPASREQRDTLAALVSDRLVELREVIRGLYGLRGEQQILTRIVPRDPVVLEQYASEVVERLRSFDRPTPRIAGAQLDTNASADQLEELKEQLSNALAGVAREVREAQDTLSRKNRALDEYDRVSSGLTRVLEGLLTIAAEDELADKVRPTIRNNRQPELEPENEPESQAQPNPPNDPVAETSSQPQ